MSLPTHFVVSICITEYCFRPSPPLLHYSVAAQLIKGISSKGDFCIVMDTVAHSIVSVKSSGFVISLYNGRLGIVIILIQNFVCDGRLQ